MNADLLHGFPSTSSVWFYLRRRAGGAHGLRAWFEEEGGWVGEVVALLFASLPLASLASALLPLAAVVRKAAGFYAMLEECGRFCGEIGFLF